MQIQHSEIELAVLEVAFSASLHHFAGLRIQGSHDVSGPEWPEEVVYWTTLTLERPFAGQCWVLATPALATLLVERKWPGMALDVGSTALLFGELIAALLNDCVPTVQADATACMDAGHCGVGVAPAPLDAYHSALWVIAGQPLFVAVEDAGLDHDVDLDVFAGWTEVSPSA